MNPTPHAAAHAGQVAAASDCADHPADQDSQNGSCRNHEYRRTK